MFSQVVRKEYADAKAGANTLIEFQRESETIVLELPRRNDEWEIVPLTTTEVYVIFEKCIQVMLPTSKHMA